MIREVVLQIILLAVLLFLAIKEQMALQSIGELEEIIQITVYGH